MNIGKTFDSILPVLGSLAPNIASMIGGPLAGMAVTELGKALGLPPAEAQDPVKVVSAVQGMTPEVAAQIKKADQEFMVKMKDLDLDVDRIATADRTNARQMQITTKDFTPRVLAGALTVGFFSLLGALCFYTIPDANQAIINVMLGALGTSFTAVINFYFGSSSSSQKKDDTIKAISLSP